MFGLCMASLVGEARAVPPAVSVSGLQPGERLGGALASAGDVNGDGFDDLVVGADGHDGTAVDTGRVYVAFGAAGGVPAAPTLGVDGVQAGASFGGSVAAAGDVNGDGYGDVVVGARRADHGQQDEGAAFVFLGFAGGLRAVPAWWAESDEAGAAFGEVVAGAGDVNGDGFDDVIVGARRHRGLAPDEGRVSLFLGSPSGLGSTAAWTADGGAADEELGRSVASAGDVNGDGYDDVIVGSSGSARLWLGSPTGPAPQPDWVVGPDPTGSGLGDPVAAAGDVNGDGFGDVVVGARWQDGAGAVHLWYGSPLGPGAVADLEVVGSQAGAAFGGAVSSAGDVDGDGFDDLLIGAEWWDGAQADEGRAFLLRGSSTGLGPLPSASVGPATAGTGFARAVASAGDVNGDGLDDVLVGAPNGGNGGEGRASLWLGR